jgi:hypothetical protein
MFYNISKYQSNRPISWMSLLENPEDDVYFAMLFPLQESLRASDPVLLRVRSKELRLHPQTP